MQQHHHADSPWRVRVDDAGGTPCGAGVLLDDLHVLTCAHVVRYASAEPGGKAGHLRITSAVCRPEWTRTARVAAGSWVHKGGTQRGDVALLRLDEPAGCGTRTTLWRAPISGGAVRTYGFPASAENSGMVTEAELAGPGGREGEWVLLNQARPGSPWIKEGYSGAGVAVLGGEFDGRVIGIVVADYIDGAERAAWMLPTETIQTYLPEIAPYTDGDRANGFGPAAGRLPDDVLGDSLRLALTRELTRLLDGTWSGTVVVGTGRATGAGASWLVRLVRTADPAARAGLSDAELTGAPGGTVLGLGAIDAAYDARGKSVADVRGYLVGRFGLSGGEDGEVVHELLRRRPPACVVVGGVDRAKDPDALVSRLLGPLAARSRSRGVRLTLGFEGRPPAGLPYEVFLDPAPMAAARPVPAAVTAEAAESAVAELAEAEDAAAELQAELGQRFFAAPRLPAAEAPRLRVRLAVARGATAQRHPHHELAVVRTRAAEAAGALTRFEATVRGLAAALKDLSETLAVNRERAARYFGEEDRELGEHYTPAMRELVEPPIDLVAARERVRRYADEVNRRIEERAGRGEG